MTLFQPERGAHSGVVIAMTQDATQISNTTSETIMVPDYPVGAGVFFPRRTLRGSVRGKMSNVVTTPGTITFRVRLGPLTLSTTNVATTGAIALDPVARTDFSWAFNFEIVCRTAGTGGTAMTMGQATISNPATGAEFTYMLPASAAASATVDTTVANILSVSAQFSVATNPTNLTAQMYLLDFPI